MRRLDSEGTVRVDLVEGDESSEPITHERAPSRRGPRERLLRVAGALVLIAMAAGTVAAELAQRRHEAALRLALSDIPGFMDPFDGPIAEVWRATGEWPIIQTEQVLVVTDEDGTTMTAIDVRSGAVAWTRDVPAGYACSPVTEDAARSPETLWDRIACARNRGSVAVGDEGGGSTLLVLDAAQGTVRLSLPMEPSALFAEPIDDDVIVVAQGQDSRIEVRRREPPDRDVWVFLSDPGLRESLVPDDGFWGYWVEDGVLWIESEAEMLALDVGTGEVVEPPVDTEPGPGTSTRDLADGGLVVGTLPFAVPGSTRVLNADGSLRFELAAEPWMPWVTDGSVAGIFAVRDEETREVVGVDAATGERVWTAGLLAGMVPTVQVDGVMVAQGAAKSVGIDIATGSTLWTADAAGTSWWAPITDGDVVLLYAFDDAGYQLVARDVRTGAVAWRVPAPQDVRYARALGRDTVLIYTGTEIVAYR